MDFWWFFINIIFLIFFGLITSLTDKKEGKIKNKHIVMAIAFGFLANAIYYNGSFLFQAIIRTSFALFIGLVIWATNLWSAGDAKLFTAYNCILSNILFNQNVLSVPLLVLINTVTPVFFFFMVLILRKTGKKEKIALLKKTASLKNIFMISVFVFSFTWLTEIIFGFFNFTPDYFITIIFLFLLLQAIKKAFKDVIKLCSVIGVLRVIFDFSKVASLPFLTNFILIVAGFIFLRFFILNLGVKVLTTPVKIKDLKPGMIPFDKIRKKDKKYVKITAAEVSLVNLLEKKVEKGFIEFGKNGLSEEDIKKLGKMKKEGKLEFESINIHQVLPFAPLLFLGVLLTVLARGNIILYIYKLLFT